MRNSRVIAYWVGGLGLLLAVVLVYVALRSAQNAPTSGTVQGDIGVTIFPQTPRATFTPELAQQVASERSEPIAATTRPPQARPTAQPQKYSVQKGDTLWSIADKLDISADDLLFANPGLKPELLQVGGELSIPGQYEEPRALGNAPATGTPYVSIEADGLRLREQAQIGGEIIRKIPAFTALRINRRSADQAWLNVTVEGKTGWVFAPYVQLNGIAQESIPTEKVAAAPTRLPTAPSAPTVRAMPKATVGIPSSADITFATPNVVASAIVYPTPVPTRAPLIIPDDPYVSGIGGRAAEIYRAGQSKGNSAHVFSVIGDSNSENPKFLKPIDWGNYDLGNYGFLQDTVDWFRGSFGRTSLAAYGGYGTAKLLDPGSARGNCSGRNAIECELGNSRPAIALILAGTGDQHSWQDFEGRYRRIIETTINYGVIPILQTKGDDLECTDNSAPCGYINGIIIKLSREYGVPLLDLRRAVNNLPNRGMINDGFHYSYPSDDRPASFSGSYLSYGFNMRNLTALRALDAVRRQIIGG